MMPPAENQDNVLDLGCAPGFWTVEFLRRGVAKKVTAGDLTQNAQDLTRQRLKLYGLEAEVTYANAEHLPFPANKFSHVNCQGVIHHTPDTEACIAEIARVLRPGGTASLSVYYKNFILRNWAVFNKIATLLGSLGVALKGRNREDMLQTNTIDEIVRKYDGEDNPIGKCYSKSDFMEMLTDYFQVKEVYYHFFPARAFPFKLPRRLHKFLDSKLPFLIYVNLIKKDN